MDNFDSQYSLQTQFRIGNVDIDKKSLTVDNVKFNFLDMTKQGPRDMMFRKSFMVFESEDKEKWLTFIWEFTDSKSLQPKLATIITAPEDQEELEEETLEEQQPNVIPDTVDVKFIHFGKTIPGKVDTGANLSSLHVEHWKALHGKNKVQFTSKMLSDNTVIMDLIDQVVVNTSEGSETRPVIMLDINIDGRDLKKVKFNLNDRSGMSDPILIGQNILEAGQFLIDPNKHKDHPERQPESQPEQPQPPMEGINWEVLEKIFESLIDGKWEEKLIQ